MCAAVRVGNNFPPETSSGFEALKIIPKICFGPAYSLTDTNNFRNVFGRPK
jgi:hypothetical protein